MKNIYTILFSLVSIFLLNACETTEKIDDFPLRPSRLVVNSYFESDSIWKFQVSNSLSVLDNADLKIIDNASIRLFKGGEFLDTISEMDEDYWYRYTDHLPVQGERYSIEVSTPDFVSVIHAEDILPQAVPLSNVDVIVTDSSFNYERYYEWGTIQRGWVEGFFEITFLDPAMEENYYRMSLYSYDVDYDYVDSTIKHIYKRSVYYQVEDASIEDQFSSDDNLLFNDFLFDGQKYKIKLSFQEWDVFKGQEFYVELESLSRTGYLYKKSISEYENASGDPFSEPVRIYSNIENGFGIFAGLSRDQFVFTLD